MSTDERSAEVAISVSKDTLISIVNFVEVIEKLVSIGSSPAQVAALRRLDSGRRRSARVRPVRPLI